MVLAALGNGLGGRIPKVSTSLKYDLCPHSATKDPSANINYLWSRLETKCPAMRYAIGFSRLEIGQPLQRHQRLPMKFEMPLYPLTRYDRGPNGRREPLRAAQISKIGP